MSRSLDTAMVAIVLAASVGYALYSLGPKALRGRLRTALADVAGALHLARIERRLRAAVGGGACGGCDSCAPSATEEAGGGAGEIRVPAASIGKRRSN
jgi:hypothetical protein